MSYEKFITEFLNIKPSDLSKISTSTDSDGSLFRHYNNNCGVVTPMTLSVVINRYNFYCGLL